MSPPARSAPSGDQASVGTTFDAVKVWRTDPDVVSNTFTVELKVAASFAPSGEKTRQSVVGIGWAPSDSVGPALLQPAGRVAAKATRTVMVGRFTWSVRAGGVKE